MFTFLVILFFISPFLWAVTVIMTSKSKSFKRITWIHSIILCVYLIFLFNYSYLFTGHDEYGIQQVGLIILTIMIHIIAGFLHGVYLNRKMRHSSH